MQLREVERGRCAISWCRVGLRERKEEYESRIMGEREVSWVLGFFGIFFFCILNS